jgi:hypothetical protein
MTRTTKTGLNRTAAAVTMCALLAFPVRAADDRADLTSTIALLGLPCGKVVKSERKGSNDHIATCQNGNRYRVTLNARGKVVAKKL